MSETKERSRKHAVSSMTPERYRKLIAKLGLSQRGAGRFLGVSATQSARMALGTASIAPPIAMLLEVLAAHDIAPAEALKLAMIWLGEEIAEGRTTTDAIEEDLYRHRQELFGEVSIAFFDTTSLYFEGAGGQTLGQFGHSKDYRPHLKQVVLGMVLDGDDRPFASFLWPGNTADVTRLMPVVQRLRERFGIAQVCIVADRGMISAATICGAGEGLYLS